jgi:replicative superfamily II helicase
MPFDFSKLSSENSTDTVISPRDIFTVLPNKDPKYQYPRDVQGEVWGAWFERRNERDLVLRMNTGGGKTVVGLIILKSCLNEGKGPVVYVAPDQYLAKQVNLEAASLGLETTDDKNSARFQSGNPR